MFRVLIIVSVLFASILVFDTNGAEKQSDTIDMPAEARRNETVLKVNVKNPEKNETLVKSCDIKLQKKEVVKKDTLKLKNSNEGFITFRNYPSSFYN